MTWTHAGLWADSLNGRSGPYVSGSVTVYVSGTLTPATLYADRAKSGTVANPATTDALGNLGLWLEPGLYDLVTPVSVTPFITITVAPDQADLVTVGGVASVFGRTGVVVAANGDYTAAQVGAVPTSRTVAAGVGLTGGGDLTGDRSFAVAYGVAANTAAQGNDTRITGAVQAASYTAFTNFGGLVNVTLGGTVPAQSRNEPGSVTRLQGTLVVGVGGILANAVFANVAAGSRPAGIPFVVGVRVTGSGANNFLNVALNGDVSYKAALAAADVIQFDGLTYIHA